MKNQGIRRAFVRAYSATDAFFGVENGNFSRFVFGFPGKLQPESVHGAALYAQAAALAGSGMGLHPVIGGVQTFAMMQLVVALEPHAAALAAVADRVRGLLPVGQAMDQSGLGGLF